MRTRTANLQVSKREKLSHSVIEPLEDRRLLAFAHPGILSTQADFDRMVTQVNAGAQPWTNGYNALTSDGYSQSGWSPRPLATVIRGGTGQNFNQMVIDMQRAFQTAVRWKVSGNTVYANQAISILNAWSSTNTSLTGNADRFLASGLYGFGWAAAAEIMRSYSGWAAADVTAFQNYLVNIYYPMQTDFLNGGSDGISHNGAYITNYWANWDMANIEGMMAIGIFADRQDIYDEAVNYLYTGGGNGALDKMAYYLHPGNLAQWQESGRDQGHTTLGMATMGHIAQMAWNQGLDLFAYNNYQFLAGAEYVAKYNLGFDVPFETYVYHMGAPGVWEGWETQTVVSGAGRGHGRLCYELIRSHYVDLLGMEAKYSEQRTAAIGVEGRGSGDEFGFGTLLYTQNPTTTPQAPRGLTAMERSRGNIQLDWFGGNNDTSYKIYRSTSSGGTYSLVASGITDLLTYTDSGLAAGTYYYKITGINGATETAYSNIASATSTTLIQTQLPFNEGTGTTATDSSGNLHSGMLQNGATWGSGKTGTAVSLDGANDYVSLPTNLVSEIADFTISTWVNLSSAATWSRIFDFGDTRGRWMFLTPKNSSGKVEFSTSTVYGYNKQSIVGTTALPTNQWVHIAVSMSKNVGRLYVNGVMVGANSNMSFPPFEIGDTTNNWLGRSQYASDPYLSGKIDDFKITRGAMSTGEIYTEATGLTAPSVPGAPTGLTAAAGAANQIILNWNAVSGATSYSVYRSTSASGPFTQISTNFTGMTYADSGLTVNIATGTQYYYLVTAANNGGEGASSAANALALPPAPAAPTSLVAHAASATSVSLSWTAGSNNASYKVWRSTTIGGPYSLVTSGLTSTSYTDPGRTTGTTYYYVVTGINAAGESAYSNEDGATPSSLATQIKFDEAIGTIAYDSTGNNWNGTLTNGPTWATGKLNGAAHLDAADDYVALPSGVVNGLTALTIASWVYLDNNTNNWTRIFDFGTGTATNMFLTPRNGSNNLLRFAIKSNNGAEQQINTTYSFPTNQWVHVAVTMNGATSGGVGYLYVNGTQVGSYSGFTLNASSLGNTTLNYLGKSQYADPYLSGSLDDFRIYSTMLTGPQVASLAQTTAPASAPTLSATANPGNSASLNWSSVAGATGYNIVRSTSSTGPFIAVASHVTSTNYLDTALTDGTTYYYQVTAEDAGGDGPYSSAVSIVALPPLPDPVTDLSAVLTNGTSIVLNWTATANAASYNVKRSSTSGGPYTTIATGLTNPTYTDSNIPNSLTYFYVIEAVNTAGISAVSNEDYESTPSAPYVPNGSFETPSISTYQYTPSGATWSFTGNSGIEHNGSAFGAANAPDGVQGAFLQSNINSNNLAIGVISQTIYATPGTYAVTFRAAQRTGKTVLPIAIKIDGVQIGSTISPTSTAWASYTSANFTIASTGSHTLTFAGVDSTTTDKNTFIDLINIVRPTISTITGTSGNDTIRLARSGTDLNVYLNDLVTPLYILPIVSQVGLSLLGSDGADTLIVDYASGDPIPSSGISFNGGNASDTIIVIGAGAADHFAINSTGVFTHGSTNASFSNAESLSLTAGNYSINSNLNGLNLLVSGSTTAATITKSQNMGNLTLDSGASVTSESTESSLPAIVAGNVSINNAMLTVAPNGQKSGVSRFSNISVEGTGKLDLHDNDLVIDFGASPNPYAALQNLVKTGLALLGGTGYGITSSEADNQTIPGTILGIIDNSAISGEISAISGYEDFSSNSILIKYTWFGDTNFDGAVSGEDYALVDTGFTSGGALNGWIFGDFNFDGSVTGEDYALIDTGFIAQDQIL